MSLTTYYNTASPHSRTVLVGVICTLVSYLLYGQSISFDYVQFDDTEYVLDNIHVNSGLSIDGIRWAFSTFYMGNWHPLTWISHMVDVSMFGTDPGAAHIHNLLLHALNSTLVYVLLTKLLANGHRAFILSLVFLVHPLHVESVAWIAERKDLLCALFFLASLLFYDRYRSTSSRVAWLLFFPSFALALLSKSMAVTLPVVLLVLDIFHYRTATNLQDFLNSLLEKWPLFAMSATTGLLAIFTQSQGAAMISMENAPLLERALTAGYGYLVYIRQMIIPTDLVAFYPFKQARLETYLLLPGFIVGIWLITALLLNRRSPLIAAGLCWYLLTLLPVIGLIKVGVQLHADRYMYLPSIGILLACAALIPNATSRWFGIGNVIAGILLIYLSVICYWQVGYWENKERLFTRVLNEAEHIWSDHDRRAEGKGQSSLLSKQPYSYRVMGDIAMTLGDTEAAIGFYGKAGQLSEPSGAQLNNLAMALAARGNLTQAREILEQALLLEADSLQIQQNYRRLFPDVPADKAVD